MTIPAPSAPLTDSEVATCVTRWGVGPGDVLAVATSGRIVPWLIDLGERLHGVPSKDNHVVIVHHVDPTGVLWGLEGRPGGVGWINCAGYLSDSRTSTNAEQPKTLAQRQLVVDNSAALLGTGYDWEGIAHDAFVDLHLGDLWREDRGFGAAPGHVVCSSYAAYLYQRSGLAHPDLGQERICQPGDWTAFNTSRAWLRA